MTARRPPSVESSRPPSVPISRAVEGWLADGRANGWSAHSITDRRQSLGRFAWWLEQEAEAEPTLEALTAFHVRTFLAYLRDPNERGRFGSPQPAAKRGARPSTVHTYYRDLRAFVRFLIAEGILESDPLHNVKTPKVPNDQVIPLAGEQMQALLDAARRGMSAERDTALVLLMVDSGLRAEEVCGLTKGSIDRTLGEITVIGKGNKKRMTYMGAAARRALWRYVEKHRHGAGDQEPIFVSTRGTKPGSRLTRNGLTQIISDLGKRAGISGVRCSPHTLRHTFAVNFLRNGGNVLELQRLLGHESLEMTRKYVLLAEVDLAQSHRAASPADRMGLR